MPVIPRHSADDRLGYLLFFLHDTFPLSVPMPVIRRIRTLILKSERQLLPGLITCLKFCTVLLLFFGERAELCRICRNIRTRTLLVDFCDFILKRCDTLLRALQIVLKLADFRLSGLLLLPVLFCRLFRRSRGFFAASFPE